MLLRNRVPQSCRSLVPPSCRSLLRGIAIAGVISASLTFTGCGTGVSNVLPAAAPPTSNTNVLSGPILGYIFSPTDGTLRAMLGIRGSARVSASIVPAGVYVAGDASVESNAGLLEDENGSLFAFDLPSAQPIHVADGLAANVRIALAPSGQIAVAYAPGSSTLTLVSGLPSSPQAQTITVGSSHQMTSAAVSDAGTVVLSSSTQIGTLAASGQFSRVAVVASSPSFSFLAGSEDLLLADGGANTLALVHSVSSNPSIQQLGAAGLNNPVGVSVSRDKHWAAVANGSDANILRVDLATGTPVQTLTCLCKPSLVSSLAGNAVFRVNSLGSGPVWTIDLAGTAPQLLFVPAISQATP